jgi:SAM-dependent methyltransferase
MVVFAAREAVMRYRDRIPSLYLMEQVTPVYKWFKEHFPQVQCTGSEYLGASRSPGKVIKGLRHEDAEHLSFDDSSFDFIVSNDVLEHIAEPFAVLKELCRVLRTGGGLLMTVPFHVDRERNERRAERGEGGVRHILPPVYHGNPIADGRSLVFMDFGWEFIQDIEYAGFNQVVMRFYWSEVYGHLGAGQHYIHAIKGSV